MAFAAPVPEPDVLESAITYSNNIVYNPYAHSLSYAGVPAPLAYNGQIIGSYTAPHLAYAKLGY